MVNEAYLKLFSLCTHLEHTPDLDLQIKEAAAQIPDWGDISAQAEAHRLVPLLYFHLKASGVSLPPEVRRELIGLTLRYRLTNQVHTRILGELITHFQQVGIELLVLKGAALSHLLYPDPGLRPMDDIDILAQRSDLEKIPFLMGKMGFQSATFSEAEMDTNRHLPPFSALVDGFDVSVEIHYSLFLDNSLHPWGETKDLICPPQTFSLKNGITGHTLGHEDLLFHLCQHAFFDNHSLGAFRLIWVTDILNFAESFADEINWDLIQKRYPAVLHTLSALNDLVPLSEHLLSLAPVFIAPHSTWVVKDLQGWPVTPLEDWKKMGLINVLRESLFPSTWWLYLHYGSNKSAPVWYYWALHTANLFKESRHRLNKRW